jgi:hypothetical protein
VVQDELVQDELTHFFHFLLLVAGMFPILCCINRARVLLKLSFISA